MNLSVVIPARNEPYLQKTIDDLLAKSERSIEIIAVLDGYWPDPPIKDDSRVTLIHHPKAEGMRPSINEAARVAKGRYLMKCDAHCCFGQGFDRILSEDCRPGYTMVPRRYSLDRRKWDRGKKLYEFQYISNWEDKRYPLKGHNWPEYNQRIGKAKKIVALMTSQGSCWFTHRKRFWDLGGLDDVNYGIMGREAQETCLKAWLSGGKYMLTRNTWYAHWKKNAGVKHPHRATYPKPRAEWNKSAKFLIDQFAHENPKWPLQKKPLSWLIEKFKPVPTWHNTESLEASRTIREKYKLNDVRQSPIKLKKAGRRDLYKLFNEIGFKVGCEVGVMEGINAKTMFKEIPDLKLYLVDPWIDYEGQRKFRGEKLLKNALKMTKIRVKPYNAEILQMFSDQAARMVPNDSLDFVYIDANHSFDYVMMDILLWVPKVRIGGIISGHDYYHSPRTKMEASRAVQAYVRQKKIFPYYLTDQMKKPYHKGDRKSSWFWVKE